MNVLISFEFIFVDRLSKREEVKLPSLGDVEGAAFGLARLHSLYGINTKKMIEEGVIKSHFDQGLQAESKPSVSKLSVWDISVIANQANKQGLYNTMIDMGTFAIQKHAEEEVEKSALDLFMQFQPNKTDLETFMKNGIEMHDQVLIRRGSRSNSHRTHERPIDPKLKKKKKYKKPFVLKDPLIDHQTIRKQSKEGDPEFHLKSSIQKEILCTGETFRVWQKMKRDYHV